MKVVVDHKIPYIHEAIERLADEVVYAEGSAFTPQLVHDADALVVRTRTRCNGDLLRGSRVRFIATATIGYDHIDTDYCRRAGIAWANAPGCNAASVAQYMESALLLLQQEKGMTLAGMTLGVVGVGHVGRRVADVARRLGMTVLLNDPPRAAAEGEAGFCPLQTLTERCDIITFHVPLICESEHRTFHLADASFFRSLARRPVFINTSRGEVADTPALLDALDEGLIADTILDVWENEPAINHTLLYKAYLGTPHIAGYSADGKANATRMSLDALCRHFRLTADYHIVPPAPATPVIHAGSTSDALLQIYNPRRDSDALKASPQAFEQLRDNYPLRREREAYRIVLNAAGFQEVSR
ncbi:MAG: 4-phosphoerythronate dehydrogenase PdxB [Prevotellaceae bacterium]|jgi:erythronate-4-phosphate dehydrogenase|nr:4-phosphoerythronate dehydrogenase PdxB [Prevotellaceae bacterium]